MRKFNLTQLDLRFHPICRIYSYAGSLQYASEQDRKTGCVLDSLYGGLGK